MARGREKFVPVSEKSLDQSFNSPVAIATFRPIENRECRRSRDRVDGLTFRNQGRIFFVRKLTKGVVVGERFRKRNRHEVQSRIRGYLRKKVDRLSNHADERGKFTRLELLQRSGIVIQHLLMPRLPRARASVFGARTATSSS